MKRFILLAGLTATALCASAQTEVVTGVMRGKDYGVTYALPKTLIEIEIKANKITYTPGDFYKYAERYLRIEQINSQPETYWELAEVSVRPIGIPDSENIHFVKMKDKSVAPLIELTADGIIKSINVPLSERAKNEEAKTEKETRAKKQTDPQKFLTQEILMAGSTAKMAELVAQEIYNIRESKNALVRGQADAMPTDGEQLKLMLDNLNEQEQTLTTMFTGTTNKEEKTYLLRLSPENTATDAVAFRFSRKLGVLGLNDLSGEPIYLKVENLNTIPEPTEEDNKKKKEEGIAYNVPGKAYVTLTQEGKTWFEGEIPVTQFGIREYLAPSLFNKNSTIKVVFNPVTGGLEKVDRSNE